MTSPTFTHTGAAPNDELTLRDFLNFLLHNKWLALVSAFAFALATAIVAEIIPAEYTASVTILPVTPEGGSLGIGSLGQTLSQFSGLASLAGVSLGGATGLKAEALATLQSRLLTNMYIQQHDLMPILFAKDWNASTNTWKSRDPKKIPTLWDADQLFAQHLRKIVVDEKTGVATLTIEWKDPRLAAQWANGLVRLTNDYLRQKATSEADREIAYLNQEIPKTSILGVKAAIYSLMEQEIKSAMIAKGRVDFALRIIDPAMPPQKKSFPQPLLWTIGGALFGLMLGYLAAIIRDAMSEAQPSRTQPSLSSTRSRESTEIA